MFILFHQEFHIFIIMYITTDYIKLSNMIQILSNFNSQLFDGIELNDLTSLFYQISSGNIIDIDEKMSQQLKTINFTRK